MDSKNITVVVFYGDDQEYRFECELTEKQLKDLLDDCAIEFDDGDVYVFDESRLPETVATEDDFGADELADLANLLGKVRMLPADLTDSQALDLIAYILSAPSLSPSSLEDIEQVLNRTDHSTVIGSGWQRH